MSFLSYYCDCKFLSQLPPGGFMSQKDMKKNSAYPSPNILYDKYVYLA